MDVDMKKKEVESFWETVVCLLCVCGQVSCSSFPAATAPPMVVTALPGSRIIRQSSQPEASATPCCGAGCVHSASAASTSLRQLRDHGDGIAGIAADSLRINGAMRNFRQVQRTFSVVRRKQWITLLIIAY